MESSYFPKPDFQEAFSAYVLVQINTEGNEHEKRHTRRLLGGTYSLPTYAVIAADGTLLAATGWTGGTDPGGTLLAWIRAPVAGADDVTQALRKGVWSFCLFAAGWG
ncbi:MAG: hypothetical protein HY608_05875, partial [Planctomycetes bacterium]|nr:hypothetical protein [Planctomycetota bacterium]